MGKHYKVEPVKNRPEENLTEMEGKWMKKTQTRTADFSSFLPAILLYRFQVFFKRVLLFQWGEKPIFVHPFYSSRQELVSGIKMFCPKRKKKKCFVLPPREDQFSCHPGRSLLQQLVPSDLPRPDGHPVPHPMCHRPGQEAEPGFRQPGG